MHFFGPIRTQRKSCEKFSCTLGMHHWPLNFRVATGLGFVNHFDYFCTREDLYKQDNLHFKPQLSLYR